MVHVSNKTVKTNYIITHGTKYMALRTSRKYARISEMWRWTGPGPVESGNFA